MRTPTAIWTLLVFLSALSSGPLAQDSETVPDIAERVGKATVTIRCQLADGVGTGSGFIVDPEGVVVTNYHVVHGCERAEIRLADGDTLNVVAVYALDPSKDLAIIRAPGFNLPVVELGDSETVRKGDKLIVLGNPLGVLEGSVTDGILSGIRELDGLRVFQMDAAVSQGNSGGPVANSDGQVVAVTSFKLTAGESLNFAIPINYARGLLNYDQRLDLTSLSDEPEESLFGEAVDEVGNSVSGRWHSVSTGTYKALRQDGEYVTGYTEVPSGAGASYNYDLKLQEDGSFSGVIRWSHRCDFLEAWANQPRSRTCGGESPIEFRLVTVDRIEGTTTSGPGPKSQSITAIRKFCKSLCKDGLPETREGFVWVRTN